MSARPPEVASLLFSLLVAGAPAETLRITGRPWPLCVAGPPDWISLIDTALLRAHGYACVPYPTGCLTVARIAAERCVSNGR